jgi:predicted lysophospholipase L1 biosynthesis ABC-type transport system permease subunit
MTSRRDGVGRAGRASASLGAIVLAALIPKCPLCVAAWLSALGLGASLGALVAPIVRPLGFALATLAIAFFVRAEHRRRRNMRPSGTSDLAA